MKGSAKKARTNVTAQSLVETNAHTDPYEQFRKWFGERMQASVLEPTAMVLATATERGVPSVRVVLLKSWDEDGFVFFTNYKSRKGNELTRNPRAALLMFWPELGRQIRIEGKVQQVSKRESREYFQSRPRDSQIGAWASLQSSVLQSRRELEAKFQEAAIRFGDGAISTPEHWGGYRVKPVRFEFWQSRPHRLHDRLCYVKQKGAWSIVRLSP